MHVGPELKAYVYKLGWTMDETTSGVSIPPNPDNQIESTVVQENIQLPRTSRFSRCSFRPALTTDVLPRACKSHRARSADLATRCTRCKLVSAVVCHRSSCTICFLRTTLSARDQACTNTKVTILQICDDPTITQIYSSPSDILDPKSIVHATSLRDGRECRNDKPETII